MKHLLWRHYNCSVTQCSRTTSGAAYYNFAHSRTGQLEFLETLVAITAVRPPLLSGTLLCLSPPISADNSFRPLFVLFYLSGTFSGQKPVSGWFCYCGLLIAFIVTFFDAVRHVLSDTGGRVILLELQKLTPHPQMSSGKIFSSQKFISPLATKPPFFLLPLLMQFMLSAFGFCFVR